MPKIKGKTRSLIDGGKNTLKKRLEAVEGTLRQGTDWLVQEIRNLYANEQIISEALEEQDVNIAAIRSLLVERGVLTDSAIDARRGELTDIKARVRAKKEQELQEQEGRPQADPELLRMQDAAIEAGKDGHPPEAFIFGG